MFLQSCMGFGREIEVGTLVNFGATAEPTSVISGYYINELPGICSVLVGITHIGSGEYTAQMLHLTRI